MPEDDLYISGTGLWLPPLKSVRDAVSEGLYNTREVEKTQLESVAASEDVYPPDMAVHAARTALSGYADPGREICLTLHAYISYQGIEMWPAAAYVHHRVVGNNAPAMEVRQMSSGGLAALMLAGEYIRARPGRRAALVTTGDRFSGPRMNRWRMELGLLVGDGGTAAVVTRQPGFARIVASVGSSDSALEAAHRGDEPFRELGTHNDPVDLAARERQYLTRVPLDVVTKRIGAGVAQVVEDALVVAGLAVPDITRWLFPHVGLGSLHSMYLEPIGLPADLDRTAWSLGRKVGHLGAGDQIAALHYLREAGELSPGDLCALVGIGAGFSYNCVIVRIESNA